MLSTIFDSKSHDMTALKRHFLKKQIQPNLTKLSDKMSNWCPIRYWKFGVDILRSFQVITNIREGAILPSLCRARVKSHLKHRCICLSANRCGESAETKAENAFISVAQRLERASPDWNYITVTIPWDRMQTLSVCNTMFRVPDVGVILQLQILNIGEEWPFDVCE